MHRKHGRVQIVSSAYCGRLIEPFGVALPVIHWDSTREPSARPSASQKGIRETTDVAPLPNLAVYENQGGAGARHRARRVRVVPA
jgi:hypothetical protein